MHLTSTRGKINYLTVLAFMLCALVGAVGCQTVPESGSRTYTAIYHDGV